MDKFRVRVLERERGIDKVRVRVLEREMDRQIQG